MADDSTPCQMFHEPPYDFAWCDTHDETFPLGSVCPHHRPQPHDRRTPAVGPTMGDGYWNENIQGPRPESHDYPKGHRP